jgi:hypothetical protein
MSTISSDQVQMLQNLLEALNAIKDSVGVSNTSTKTTSKKKVKDPNAPKRPLNSKIVALNEERKKVYEEMQASYFEANPSAVGMEPAEIRKLAKEGKMPPFPTYPQALKEHSRRMSEADPEHAKKSKARREALDALQAERKKEKTSSKNSETSSVASAPSDDKSEVVAEVVTSDSPIPPPPTAAPAPAPAPAPATEEKKSRGRPKKVKTAEVAPAKSEPIVKKVFESTDSEEFNMELQIGDEKLLLNGENWVITKDQTWVGLWNPETKELDRSVPEPA